MDENLDWKKFEKEALEKLKPGRKAGGCRPKK